MDELNGVTVIWCAKHPNNTDLYVVGWYENATAFSKPQQPTGNLKRLRKDTAFYFKATPANVKLILPHERVLVVPRRKSLTDKDYIGQRNWFFPRGRENYVKFLEAFAEYRNTLMLSRLESHNVNSEEYQEGQRKRAEILTTIRNQKLVEDAKNRLGYKCQVCCMDFEATYGPLGRGFIEVHHLVPIAFWGRQIFDPRGRGRFVFKLSQHGTSS